MQALALRFIELTRKSDTILVSHVRYDMYELGSCACTSPKGSRAWSSVLSFREPLASKRRFHGVYAWWTNYTMVRQCELPEMYTSVGNVVGIIGRIMNPDGQETELLRLRYRDRNLESM